MKMNTSQNLIILFVLIGLTFVPLAFVKADFGVSLYLSPATGSYKMGDLINVSVMVDTGDETINAIKTVLSFSDNLEVQSVSKSGSIFGLWVEDPFYDNTAKTISFGGAGAGTTYKGSTGKLISVTLKANEAGEETIEFASSIVKYGGTTIEVKSTSGGNYAVAVPAPQPQVEEGTQKPAEQPVLTPEQTIQEPAPAEEEAIGEVTTPEESAAAGETISQQSFLASMATVWGGASQFTLLAIITGFCLVFLTFLGIKEWRLFQRKKNIK